MRLVKQISIFCVIALVVASCSPNTRQVKFYQLQATQQAGQVGTVTQAANPIIIGLGPVDIPAYLDRPQIVTVGEGAELTMAEYHRWAEPLKETITRVLAENLTTLMPGYYVLAFPWNRAVNPSFQLEVKINRFQVNESGDCELKANWTLLKQNKPLSINTFKTHTVASGSDYAAKVAAQSQALAKFGTEMSANLRVFTEAQ